jgi:hypothetical protein
VAFLGQVWDQEHRDRAERMPRLKFLTKAGSLWLPTHIGVSDLTPFFLPKDWVAACTRVP